MKRRLAGFLISFLVFILGFLSLTAPFVLPQAGNTEGQNSSYAVMISLIIGLCLLLMVFEIQSSVMDSKMIAFLGILIAINAGIRFLENAIPGPAGFSPIFFLILLTGYYFGNRIGFLMGALTMLVSGLITGGIGPWLPGQMITAGWVGQSAALIRPMVARLKWQSKAGEVVLLAILGAFWGLLYGAIMNLWFWPYLGAGSGQTWLQNAGLAANFNRYLAYYLATSIVWDITRAIGNVLLIAVLTRPVLATFERFQRRFSFQWTGNPS